MLLTQPIVVPKSKVPCFKANQLCLKKPLLGLHIAAIVFQKFLEFLASFYLACALHIETHSDSKNVFNFIKYMEVKFQRFELDRTKVIYICIFRISLLKVRTSFNDFFVAEYLFLQPKASGCVYVAWSRYIRS